MISPGPNLLDVAEMISEIVAYPDNFLQDVTTTNFKTQEEMIVVTGLPMLIIFHVADLMTISHHQQGHGVIELQTEIAMVDLIDLHSSLHKQAQD
jgi:hypothetical protein